MHTRTELIQLHKQNIISTYTR